LAIRKEQAHLIDNAGDELENADDGAVDEEEAEDDEAEKQVKDHRNLVIEVTNENISEFTLNEVVMPMVGYDIKLPANE